ncbi:MAG: GMP reductase [Candidatus Woesearchaeota archaeon]
MRIENDIKLDFDDVLLKPKRSTLTSRKDVILEREFTFNHSPKVWTGIPIIASNMDTTGTFEIAQALRKHKLVTILHKHYTIEELAEKLPLINDPDYVGYSLGISQLDWDKFMHVIQNGLGKYFSFVCLDVPNGYLESFVETVKKLRSTVPEHIIIAGNVVTGEIAEELLLQGADIVKVGIGSGSACLTRRKTGVGYPQLSAVIECADAAHGINTSTSYGKIISDGGIVYPCDIAKAFCAGADFVMCGSLFAGFSESGGELVVQNERQYKAYYGMSSSKAMQKHYGIKAQYRASEGRETLIPFKGEITPFIEDILGSLRSTGTYIGARNVKEFSRRATFVQVHNQLNQSLNQFDNGKHI